MSLREIHVVWKTLKKCLLTMHLVRQKLIVLQILADGMFQELQICEICFLNLVDLQIILLVLTCQLEK